MSWAARNRPRLVLGLALVLSLHSQVLLAGEPASASALERRHVALLLLIDRSPSLGSKAEPTQNFVEEASKEITAEVMSLAKIHDASFSFGAINFGGVVGDELPIRDVRRGESPQLPRREAIPNTDLTVALEEALKATKAFRLRQPLGGLLVFLVTTDIPLVLAIGEGQTGNGARHQFLKPSLQRLKNSIEILDARVCFVRSQSSASDAREWIGYLGRGSVVSVAGYNFSDLRRFVSEVGSRSILEESAGIRGDSDATNGSNQPEEASPASPPDLVLAEGFGRRWHLEGLAGTAAGFLIAWVVLRGPHGLRSARHWLTRQAARWEAKRGRRGKWGDLLDKGLLKLDGDIARIDLTTEQAKEPLRRQISAYLRLGFTFVKEESAQQDFIRRQLQNTVSHERVQGVAVLLLDRWSKHEGQFEKELFVFLAEPMGGALLDYVAAQSSIALDREQGYRSDLLRNLATSLTNLREALTHQSENLPECLRTYAQSLREAIELQPNPPVLSFEIYELLEDYLRARPVGRAYVLKPLPIHLEKMVTDIEENLDNDLSLGESIDRLLELRAKVGTSGWRYLPEAGVLLVAVDRWRGIVSGSEAGLVELMLSPFLDHGGESESVTDSAGKTCSVLPVCIRNRGLVPVGDLDLVLTFETADGAEGESLDGIERVGIRRKPVEGLAGGASRMELFRVWHGLKSAFSIRADYIRDRKTGRRDKSNTLQVIPGPIETRGEVTGSGNPYRPDAPLTTPQQWNLLAQGEHQTIIERLVGDPNLRMGRAYAILGLRRTGKTSLLRCLSWRLEETDQFLPVYVDIFLWYRSLNQQDRKKKLTERELYYEIAEASIRAATLRFNEDFRHLSARKDTSAPGAEDLERSAVELGEILLKLGRAISKTIVIIVDDLDWWLNKPEFVDTGQKILAPLCALASEGNFSLFISHDLTTAAWKEKYLLDEPLMPTPHPIPLLKQEDVERLLSSSGAPLTRMAREYLWRVTGGWPGVVHLFAYGIMEEWYRNVSDRERRVIDLDLARTTVKIMIRSSVYQHFFRYFVEALEPQEREMLAAVARFGFIEPGSMILRGFQHDAAGVLGFVIPEEFGGTFPVGVVQTLIEKEIVERLDGSARACRLRVGFLAFPHVFEGIILNPLGAGVEESPALLCE